MKIYRASDNIFGDFVKAPGVSPRSVSRHDQAAAEVEPHGFRELTDDDMQAPGAISSGAPIRDHNFYSLFVNKDPQVDLVSGEPVSWMLRRMYDGGPSWHLTRLTHGSDILPSRHSIRADSLDEAMEHKRRAEAGDLSGFEDWTTRMDGYA